MLKKLSTPDARARDAPITTLILEEKAKQFATRMNKPDFNVSNGWWKTRNGIKYKKAHGEKNDADHESAEMLSDVLNHGTSTMLMKQEFTTELFLMVP